jgi:hypothetical protein
MPATWKVLFTTLNTGAIVGELPAQSFSFSDVLNADGSFRVSMPLVTTTPTGRLVNDVSAVQLSDATLAPGMTGIHFQRDNALMWSGIVWGVQADVESNTLSVSGAGFMSYFKRRLIKVDTTYSSVEQLDIARDLIDDAQALGGGDIQVKTSETTASGTTRDRTYLGYERRVVGEVIEQLANVNDGFDFRFDPGFVSDAIEVEFRTSHKATGRRTNHVLELGTNVQVLGFQSSGTNLTNHVDVLGGGDGDDIPIGTAQDPAGLTSRPLLETVRSEVTVTTTATLVEHAKRLIARGSEPMVELDVAIFSGEIPVLGSYDVGDQLTVRGTYGYISVDSWYRITSTTVSVADDGSENVKLRLIPIGIFDE